MLTNRNTKHRNFEPFLTKKLRIFALSKQPIRELKIAVNTRLLLKNKLEGIGWFTYESLSRIVKSHPEHEFIFIFDRKYDEQFVFGDNVTPVVIGPQARHPRTAQRQEVRQ